MINSSKTRRVVSLVIALAMMMPIFSTAVEAAIANWLSPQPGQQLTSRYVEVSVGFNTQSDLEITRLELWVDGKHSETKHLVRPSSRGVISFSWDTAQYPQGAHKLEVRVYAGGELVSTVNGTGTIGNAGGYDIRPPTVSFSNIKANDVLKGKATIEMEASDDSGKPPLVSLLVDDKLKLIQNTPPYNYVLDTTTYVDGEHQLETYAYDDAGNKSDPAVVKVVFRNGMTKPVVATMRVEIPDDVENELPDLLPSISQSTAFSTDSAARAVQPDIAPEPARPVAAQPDMSNLAATDIAPASTSNAEPVVDSVSTNLKSAASDVISSGSANATEPDMPMSAASESEPEVMAMLPVGEIRSHQSASNMSADSISASEEIPEAVEADADLSLEIAALPTELRASSKDTVMADDIDAPKAPVFADNASESLPESVEVAMLPDVISANSAKQLTPEIARVPVITEPAKAKLERKVVALKGKLKVRDLVNDLGGMLLWNQKTHTATAYVSNMKIELQLDNPVVKVNGKEMTVAEAPSIVDGRMMIDADVYYQACAMLQGGVLVAMVVTE